MTLLEVSKTGSDRSVHIKITTSELCIILAALEQISPEWKPGNNAEKTLRAKTRKIFNEVERVISGLAAVKKRTSVPNRQVYHSGEREMEQV